MAGRTGFFGGLRGNDTPERDADTEFGLDGLIVGPLWSASTTPNGDAPMALAPRPAFDPIWGTLGAAIRRPLTTRGRGRGPGCRGRDLRQWLPDLRTDPHRPVRPTIRRINMQSGFIAIRDALHVPPGQGRSPRSRSAEGHAEGPLEPNSDDGRTVGRPGATSGSAGRPEATAQGLDRPPGYRLEGNFHIHAHGAMTQFLESPDPHFLPITEVTVPGPVQCGDGRPLPVRDGQS